ncbi:MAG: PP2C family protein-serine/threonine phosphatase [Planctomycetota bacterium]|jgi:hypothetical protein|nr:PP2C family protein-serine/threonine phosphatase [Planctomycetota bacterium]
MRGHLSSTEILGSLSEAASGEIHWQRLDVQGEILSSGGQGPAPEHHEDHGDVFIDPGAGRSLFQSQLPDGDRIVLTYSTGCGHGLAPFLGHLLHLIAEKEAVEQDMESINASSLALLEEVSMIGDTLPKLSTGESEERVIEMALKALVVAASVERAVYLRLHDSVDRFDVISQVVAEEGGWNSVAQAWDGEPIVGEDDGIVWRAATGGGKPLLESVGSGCLGAGLQELASSEVVAMPVRYGSIAKQTTLGVLLVMDKRANAYSSAERLGSHETKMITGIASMLGAVLGTRKVAELGQELKTANKIQQQILPDHPPEIDGFDVDGRCVNSGAVGGDYFDYLSMPDGRSMVIVADVSGHNLASGMIMVGARASLHALAAQKSGVAEVFDDLARVLHPDLMRTERFITAASVELTPGSSRALLVNAGHNDTLIYRAATGEVERFPSSNTIIGFLQDQDHESCDIDLGIDDVILIYTDGVTEAVNAQEEMFGEERLMELLRRSAGGNARQILSSVFDEVGDFSDPMSLSDDITAVVLKKTSCRGDGR